MTALEPSGAEAPDHACFESCGEAEAELLAAAFAGAVGAELLAAGAAGCVAVVASGAIQLSNCSRVPTPNLYPFALLYNQSRLAESAHTVLTNSLKSLPTVQPRLLS